MHFSTCLTGFGPLHRFPVATLNYILIPLTVLLLRLWLRSKTEESLFGRLSEPVVPTSSCGLFRIDTLKNTRYSKNTQLNSSLITGTKRCNGNTSEIFQWAAEKSYKKSKKKIFTNPSPSDVFYALFPRSKNNNNNNTSNSCILNSLQLYAIFMTLFLIFLYSMKYSWPIW